MAATGDNLRAAVRHNSERRNSAESDSDGFMADVPRAPEEEVDPKRKNSLIDQWTIGDGTITPNISRRGGQGLEEQLETRPAESSELREISPDREDGIVEKVQKQQLEVDQDPRETVADRIAREKNIRSPTDSPSVTMADFEQACMGEVEKPVTAAHSEQVSATASRDGDDDNLQKENEAVRLSVEIDGKEVSGPHRERQMSFQDVSINNVVGENASSLGSPSADISDLDGACVVTSMNELAEPTNERLAAEEDVKEPMDVPADDETSSIQHLRVPAIPTREQESAEKSPVEDTEALEEDLMAIEKVVTDHPSLEENTALDAEADKKIWVEEARHEATSPHTALGQESSANLVDASNNIAMPKSSVNELMSRVDALDSAIPKMPDDELVSAESRSESYKKLPDYGEAKAKQSQEPSSPSQSSKAFEEENRILEGRVRLQAAEIAQSSKAFKDECVVAMRQREETRLLEGKVQSQAEEIEVLNDGLHHIQDRSEQIILQGFHFNEQLAEQTDRCQDLSEQVRELNAQLRQREVDIKRSRQQTLDVSEAEQMCKKRLEHREAMCEQALAYGAYCENAYSEVKAVLPNELTQLEQHVQEREARCESFLEAAAGAAKKLSASCSSEIADLREELKSHWHEFTEESLAHASAMNRIAELELARDDCELAHKSCAHELLQLQEAHEVLVQRSNHVDEERRTALQQNQLLQEHLCSSGEVVTKLRFELTESHMVESKVALHGKQVEESLVARPSHELVMQLESELASCRSQLSTQKMSAEQRVGLLEARLALREAQLGLRAEQNMDQSSLDSYRSSQSDRQRSPLRTPGASLGFSSPGFASPWDVGGRVAGYDMPSPHELKQSPKFPDVYSEYRPMFEIPVGQLREASRYGSPFSPGSERLRPHR